MPGFFDLLVVDEASQCDIASALPLLFRVKRVVVIGDPMQLPHISTLSTAQDQQLRDQHLTGEDRIRWSYPAVSLFHLAQGLASAEDMVVLKDHHRSHLDIIQFSNEHFYDGDLRVVTRYQRLRRPAPAETAVRWVDVPGKARRPPDGGAVNEVEAQAVVDRVRHLLLDQAYRGTIGVVTPFRAQANLIRRLLHEKADLVPLLEPAELLVDTAHAFQGDERDVVFFSPVVAPGIASGALWFLNSSGNLFNVGITRARSALVAVGDLRAALGSEVGYLAAFAQYCQRLAAEEGRELDLHADLGPAYPPVARPDDVSDWERYMYQVLYGRGFRPVPQYPVDQYRLDFALFAGERRLDLEIDGEHHRDWDGELCRRDQIRNQRLIELGWDVMRFWVCEVRDDLERCLDRVERWSHGQTLQTAADHDGVRRPSAV